MASGPLQAAAIPPPSWPPLIARFARLRTTVVWTSETVPFVAETILPPDEPARLAVMVEFSTLSSAFPLSPTKMPPPLPNASFPAIVDETIAALEPGRPRRPRPRRRRRRSWNG